jgi:membrane-associated protein
MELIAQLVDVFLHLDRYLLGFLSDYGLWVYALLFAIIFAETGFVVTPFLPGDSLLFVAGTLAAGSGLDVQWLIPLLIAASFSGDNTNYWIGHHLGKRLVHNTKLVNPDYLKHTQEFYKKYGSKTIVLSRFVPIIRTFAPFVAGVGSMSYPTFMFYNIIGALLWVGLFTMGGYLFGNIPWVQANFGIVVIGIIILSIIPAVIEFLRHRRHNAVPVEAQ